MAKNILNVNSANIQTFGFASAFDLLAKTLSFDITGLSVFNTGGAANVIGIAFSVTDPSGLEIASIDFTSPAINPSTQSTFTVNLTGGFAMFGWYTIVGVIRDQDGKDYTITLVKEVCVPAGFVKNGYVPASFSADVDCNIPIITFSELTPFIYKGKGPLSVAKTGVLSYPPNTLADLNFTETPFSISGAGMVYTGRYTINNISAASFDLLDGVILVISYKLIGQEHVVTCMSSVSSILCCIAELEEQYESDPFSSTGKAIKARLDKITGKFLIAVAKEKSGKDASDEVAQIAKILDCDCNCGSNTIEPQPIIQGAAINNLNIVGAHAAAVTPSTSGSTTTYTVDVKNILVTNGTANPSFTINRVVTGSAISYQLVFNTPVLANDLLTAIQDDDDLTALLRNIVNATNTGISLDGLDGGCVISLANCDYSLIESNNLAKTVVSIKIGGTVHNAPSNLLLSSLSSVAAWLNGLSLGTFSVTLDSGTNTVIISSTANPNQITDFVMTTSAGTVIRQFSRSCIGLVAFLNAVITFICDLQAEQIAFGVTGMQQYSYNNDYSINKVNISANAHLNGVLFGLLSAVAALFNRLNDIGLTCANVKTAFQPVDLTLVSTDGVLAIKGDTCARIPFHELSTIVMNQIIASTDLQSLLCGATAGCAGPVCAPPTNVSAVFASGTITVNANNVAPNTTPIQIQYRVRDSGLTFTEVDTTTASLPIAIGAGGLANAQYEVQMRKQCGNGVYSPWVPVLTNNACAGPVGFSVAVSGSNFVVSATLNSGQTKIQVVMTDPNGGQSTVLHDFGAVSGTFNITIPVGLYGNYTFIGSAVCDSTTTPMFQSAFTSPSTIDYENPSSNNFTANDAYGPYGIYFTDISNGTTSGVPAAFNSVVNSHSIQANCPILSSGTINVGIGGALPASPPLFLYLLKNNVQIQKIAITTVPATMTLTNPGSIVYPDLITIEIDS